MKFRTFLIIFLTFFFGFLNFSKGYEVLENIGLSQSASSYTLNSISNYNGQYYYYYKVNNLNFGSTGTITHVSFGGLSSSDSLTGGTMSVYLCNNNQMITRYTLPRILDGSSCSIIGSGDILVSDYENFYFINKTFTNKQILFLTNGFDSSLESPSIFLGITSHGNINTRDSFIKNYKGYISQDECPSCSVQYSSLECQTEYNLIPIEDVNANYCNINFGMIDPRECPTTEGTGTISWTPRFINDEQYPGTNILNINIPENIEHTVIYNQEETIVNVEGYNADENYINGILQNERLTPTNKDIEEMITGFMTNYFPYLALAMIFLYLARIIFKLFK